MVAGVVLALLIISADSNLAGAWRRGARELIGPPIAAGKRVWFAGTWGFYWYAERAGARPLSSRPPLPARGDWVVSCSSGPNDPKPRISPACRPIQHVAEAAPGGRIFGGTPSAGFYSNYWGYLPWTWSSDELTSFDVCRLE